MKLRGFKNSCSDENHNISVQGFYVSRCHCERSLKRKMHGTGDSVQTSFVHDVPVSLKGFLASNKNTHRFS